jgi:hypothetical protein
LRCAADLPAFDGATSCSAQESRRRKRLQGHRQRSRCSPRDLMHRRRLIMCRVPSCVAVVSARSVNWTKEPCSTRWCPRSWSLDRPRTGGGRREHRHARGARRDARRSAAGAAGWHGHALRCRPTRDARRDRTTATSRRGRVMRIPVYRSPVPVRMPTCLTRDESRGPCARTGDEKKKHYSCCVEL